MTRPWLRWLPAAVVPAALAAAALAGSYQAGAATSLPHKTAAEVIAMIGHSEVRALSGTLQQNSELGLPQLPTTGPAATQGPASVIELLSGSHTARVFMDGPSKARFQVMDMLAERDLVRNGNDLWLYNSADNSAAHMTLPAPPKTGSPAPHATPTPGMATPDVIAQHFLAAVEPSTELTVGDGTTVAGRTAYQLVVKPRSTGTLVDSVTIAVDSATGLPLGVVVRARGQAAAAFSLAFTDVKLSAPDAGLFSFTPPQGAAVEQKAVPQPRTVPGKTGPAPEKAAAGRPTMTGSGWDAVIALPAGAVPADVRTAPMSAQLTQAVPGGRALTTSLVSVLMLDDGRVFAGMVPLERLRAAAAPQ